MNKSVFFLLFIFVCVHGNAQHEWSFEGDDVLKASSAFFKTSWHGVRSIPEKTGGIKGAGLRTDGYSSWLDIQCIQPLTSSGISGWFALESYPTDTAGFIGIINSEKESVAICVNRFGKIVFGIGKDGEYHYEPTYCYVNKFKWINVLVTTDGDILNFYIDGKKIVPYNEITNSFKEISGIYVAKDFRSKGQEFNNRTVINGIVDELTLWTSSVDFEIINREVAEAKNKTPILAIPESRFAGDFSRPKYHLLPAANWTNETHGLLLYKDTYHIFNQKNASGLSLSQMNWGHFSSPDLVNWTEQKPAVTPEEGYDMNGNWSGHAVINDDGVPVLIYTTGGAKYGTGLSFPVDDKLIEWKKYEANPVIYGQPEQYTRTDPRDQYAWKENDIWYMIIGFGIVEEGEEKGAVLLYKSKDLKNWDFVHTMYEGNPKIDQTGVFWEMPVFVKLNGKYILMVNRTPQRGEGGNIPARTQYWVGDFKNERFIPDNPVPQNLEVINRLLSPSVEFDKAGRLTAIGIIPDEGGTPANQRGWTHLYSIPRVWNLVNGKIHQTPHPALETLRGKHVHIENQKVKSGTSLPLYQGQQLELKAKIKPGRAVNYGFILYKNEDNSEYTKVYYDAKKKEFAVIIQTKSAPRENMPQRENTPLRTRIDTYQMDNTKEVEFHLFIDGSVLEVFINGKDAFTSRVFPLHKESDRVEVFTEGGDINAETDIWEMNPAKMSTNF